MNAVDIIKRKRNGKHLTDDALSYLVAAYTSGDIPDYQMSAFLMSVYFNGMSSAELGVWTRQMLHSGEVLDLSEIDGAKVDKHSTGGIGDKISLILAPLAVAAGLKVPMISGRGLGHTGGTLDKLESIPGFNVNLSADEFRKQVAELGCALIGQTGQIAPADKKLYALRDVTGTVESIPLIASSIMSKKLAEGIDRLVLDVKVGSGAFMKTIEDARELAQTMVGIGNEMERPTVALLTDMSQPLGDAIGNALEVIESLETLKGNGPKDVEDLTIALVLEMLGETDQTADDLRGYLNDGSAFAVFENIVRVQGGSVESLHDYSKLPTAAHETALEATQDGFVNYVNTAEVGMSATELGAGRKTKESVIDPAVGLLALKRQGDPVSKGEPVFTIKHNGAGLEKCQERLAKTFEIVDDKPTVPPLIFERIS